MMATMKLFATDLDGTLLDREDAIHPNDRAAIARAREAGVIVTLATGRLTSRTHPTARALGLDTQLVCADGAVRSCSITERILRRHALSCEVVHHTLELLQQHALASFAFTHDSIHSCERGVAHHAYVRAWSHSITAHKDVCRASSWRGESDSAIMLVGIGERGGVDAVAAKLEALQPELELFTFDSAGTSVLRVMVKGASKGAALLELAEELGVDREHIGVVGDWYNDISMFQVAGCSYAMPHAPDDVKAAASCVLAEEASRRGAIADALARFQAELGD